MTDTESIISQATIKGPLRGTVANIAFTIGRRLASAVLLLFVATLGAFSLIYLIPGDPVLALAPEGATLEELEMLRERLGFDRPAYEQYLNWLGNALHGDLGNSILFGGLPVADVIGERFWVTVSLAVCTLLLVVPLTIAISLAAALNQGRFIDRVVITMSSVGVAIPGFVFGILLITIFALKSRLLPASGYVPFTEAPLDFIRFMILPTITLGFLLLAELTRYLRIGIIDVLKQPYVVSARARGLTSPRVLGSHVLKNAAIPSLNVLGVNVIGLLSGAVIVESLFVIPGIGALIVRAVSSRDIAVVQGVVLLVAVIAVIVTIIVDLLSATLDPRLRSRT